LCGCDSVTGHGWRPKQAHDDSHNWIRYCRGECQICGVTVSFLPSFSLPYTHYSLVARSEALRRRFVEGRSWEDAAPPLKDPDRVPTPSTLRRWCCNLDSSHPAFSFLRRAQRHLEDEPRRKLRRMAQRLLKISRDWPVKLS
jgi:hypothetical protein